MLKMCHDYLLILYLWKMDGDSIRIVHLVCCLKPGFHIITGGAQPHESPAERNRTNHRRSATARITGGICQTLADSLILGFISVPILSQNYRFSSVQDYLSEI